jgi:hypothetical protein
MQSNIKIEDPFVNILATSSDPQLKINPPPKKIPSQLLCICECNESEKGIWSFFVFFKKLILFMVTKKLKI